MKGVVSVCVYLARRDYNIRHAWNVGIYERYSKTEALGLFTMRVTSDEDENNYLSAHPSIIGPLLPAG